MSRQPVRWQRRELATSSGVIGTWARRNCGGRLTGVDRWRAELPGTESRCLSLVPAGRALVAWSAQRQSSLHDKGPASSLSCGRFFKIVNESVERETILAGNQILQFLWCELQILIAKH